MKRCSLCLRSRSDLAGRFVVLALAALCFCGLASDALSATGSVSGTIRVDRTKIRGDGPKHDKDLVVSLEPLGAAAPARKPSMAIMDQKGLVFVPHVLAIQKGSSVRFLNSDSEQHNVYFLDDQTGKTLDIGTWGPGVSVDHTFATSGPVIVLCKLHLEMAAYVVVVDSPWFTTVQIDPASLEATFELKGIPAGDYRLSVWHKKLKLKGGSRRISVKPGGNILQDLVVTKARYAK